MEALISARHLHKRYGKFTALNDLNFDIQRGQFIGLIGSNGAGKTTLLQALTGLGDYEGELKVLGMNPLKDRHRLMHQACFIADVATLPKWIRIDQLIEYVAGVHPQFKREKALANLSKTKIELNKTVKQLSKGMQAQLHLAIVMAIDVPLLILDEPTLGLDILFRREFYSALLEDYFDANKTVIISTHQAEEIEHLLTDIIFIQDGKIALQSSIDDIASHYSELICNAINAEDARALNPIYERKAVGQYYFLFQNADKTKLQALGEIRTPSIADLFVALMKGVAA